MKHETWNTLEHTEANKIKCGNSKRRIDDNFISNSHTYYIRSLLHMLAGEQCKHKIIWNFNCFLPFSYVFSVSLSIMLLTSIWTLPQSPFLVLFSMNVHIARDQEKHVSFVLHGTIEEMGLGWSSRFGMGRIKVIEVRCIDK